MSRRRVCQWHQGMHCCVQEVQGHDVCASMVLLMKTSRRQGVVVSSAAGVVGST